MMEMTTNEQVMMRDHILPLHAPCIKACSLSDANESMTGQKQRHGLIEVSKK